MVEINKPSCRVTSCNFMLPHLEPLPLSSPSLAVLSPLGRSHGRFGAWYYGGDGGTRSLFI